MKLSLVRSFSVSTRRTAAWVSPEYGRPKTMKNEMVRQIYNNYNYHLVSWLLFVSFANHFILFLFQRRMPYPYTQGAQMTQYPWGQFLKHNRDAKLTWWFTQAGLFFLVYWQILEIKRTNANRDARRQEKLAKERETPRK